MKYRFKKTNSIPLLALLSTLAGILQIAAGLFPGPGHIISIFATVPILMASSLSFTSGIKVYTVATFIIFIIQPLEAPIFLFTTGLLGLSLGYGIRKEWNQKKIIISSGLVLTIGIIIAIYLLGIPLLGGIGIKGDLFLNLLMIVSFSLIYTKIWISTVDFINNF